MYFNFKMNFHYETVFTKDKCNVNTHFKNSIKECFEEYNSITQEEASFDINWNTFDSSYSPNLTYSNVYNAFLFTQSSTTNSYPYQGQIHTYLGGGYVFKMKPPINSISIDILKSNNWLNKQTSALFIEFTLYNPNLNLYEHCLILFEVLSTGNFVNSAEFYSIDLSEVTNDKILTFKILVFIIYLIFIVIFMIDEIMKFIRLR